jgi:hypothetical protein
LKSRLLVPKLWAPTMPGSIINTNVQARSENRGFRRRYRVEFAARGADAERVSCFIVCRAPVIDYLGYGQPF